MPGSVYVCTGHPHAALTWFKRYFAGHFGFLLDRWTSSQIILLLNPSTQPWIENPNGFNLSYLSICQQKLGPRETHSTPQIMTLPLFHSPRINFSHWWFYQSSRNINLVSKTQGMPHCLVPVQAIRTGTYFLQNYLLDAFLEFLTNHFTPRKPKVFKPSLDSSLIHT